MARTGADSDEWWCRYAARSGPEGAGQPLIAETRPRHPGPQRIRKTRIDGRRSWRGLQFRDRSVVPRRRHLRARQGTCGLSRTAQDALKRDRRGQGGDQGHGHDGGEEGEEIAHHIGGRIRVVEESGAEGDVDDDELHRPSGAHANPDAQGLPAVQSGPVGREPGTDQFTEEGSQHQK